VLAKCPRCGHVFYVAEPPRQKGSGAGYKIESLGRLHLEILRILAEASGCGEQLTRKAISYRLHLKGYKTPATSVAARLSELLALGYVQMSKRRVREGDKWVTRPVWTITPQGLQKLVELRHKIGGLDRYIK